jgi:hypothetical protein
MWWLISRGWRELPPVDLNTYPAHVHVGIDIEALGASSPFAWWPVWMRILERVEVTLKSRGCQGVHGHVAEPTGQHAITRRIRGYDWWVLEQRPFSLFARITGGQWVIRAIGKDLS